MRAHLGPGIREPSEKGTRALEMALDCTFPASVAIRPIKPPIEIRILEFHRFSLASNFFQASSLIIETIGFQRDNMLRGLGPKGKPKQFCKTRIKKCKMIQQHVLCNN